MNSRLRSGLAWGLAVVAVAAGYVGYGWPGVVLAMTVVVFWLLLQFSRALRVMRAAAGRPVGYVANAVMLHARLSVGMTLAQVIKLSGSLGQAHALATGTAQTNGAEEVFAWRDESGDEVRVELRAGKLLSWQLQRAGAAAGTNVNANASTSP